MRLFVSLISVGAAAAAVMSAQPRLTLDYPAMARVIVERLSLRPGERVLSVAHPGTFAEMIPHIRYEVMRAGGVDLGVVEVLQEPVPASFEPAVLQKGARESRSHYKAMFREVDAAIMMPGANTSHAAYLAMQDWLKDDQADRRGRRTIHFHWLEAGSAYPIAGQPLPPRFAMDALYQRALVDTNYQALAESQRRFAAALRTGEVHITSPSGTDLRFRTGDRPVNFQDGDASRSRTAAGVTLIDKEIELPSGAIRVAPIEESVEGVIAFPPSQWDGRPVEGLKLRFARGRVVAITATSGQEAVDAEMRVAGTPAAPSGSSHSGSIRCWRFRSASRGFPTMATAPAWCGCRSATTLNWVGPLLAGMSAGTSSPISRSPSDRRRGCAAAASPDLLPEAYNGAMARRQRAELLTALTVVLAVVSCGCQVRAQQGAAAREQMVESQLKERGITHAGVLDAMRRVPRHRFVPDALDGRAYDDTPLPIGEGQTISQPYIVAYMTEALEPKPADRVLEIGTGSGYQAAILAELVKEVYTIELVPALAERARTVLGNWATRTFARSRVTATSGGPRPRRSTRSSLPPLLMKYRPCSSISSP